MKVMYPPTKSSVATNKMNSKPFISFMIEGSLTSATTSSSSQRKGMMAKQEVGREAHIVNTFQSMRTHTTKKPMIDQTED